MLTGSYTAIDRAAVPYTGERSGTAPLTWAQQLLLYDSRWMGDEDHYFNIGFVVECSRRPTVDEATSIVRTVIERHEALRTRLRIDPDTQDLPQRGEIPMWIVAAEADDDTAARVLAELRAHSFRPGDELPTRLALITEAGAVREIVVVLSHVFVDGYGGYLVVNELKALLSGAAASALPRVTQQPLDQAAFECSPAGQRRSAHTIAHWRQTLATAPVTMFPEPAVAPSTPDRFRRVMMRSEALAACLHRIALDNNTTTSIVLMALNAVVLGLVAGHDTVVVKLALGNRGYPELRHAVGITLGNSVMASDVRTGTFEDLIKRTNRAALAANMRARCDPAALDVMLAELGAERGAPIDLSSFFNDFRWDTAPEARAALLTQPFLARMRAHTTVEGVGEWDRQNARFFYHTGVSPTEMTFNLMTDTAVVPAARAEQCLKGMEELAVAATFAEVKLSDAASVSGIG
jgi:hypothetical protein